MTGNIYLDLTNQFNEGRLRAILSSGQAVVVHGLAFASKDGDWIVREDDESLRHILEVLENRGAKYRLGAPLDTRWMRGGWSAHLEFNHHSERIRCDFVTRPPRLAPDDLAQMWLEIEAGQGVQDPVPTLDLRRLAELKKTDRERDYGFIGEIARLFPDLSQQILLSRSALDLIALWPRLNLEEQQKHLQQRPLLAKVKLGRDELEIALDAERRALFRVNEARLLAFERAATPWRQQWPQIARSVSAFTLSQAHRFVVENAKNLLPEEPNGKS